MSCCGQGRWQARRVNTEAALPGAGANHSRPVASAGVLFEYIGGTGLTAMGPVTGKRYRFGRPGAQVGVDPRDASALAAVPVLRRVNIDHTAFYT